MRFVMFAAVVGMALAGCATTGSNATAREESVQPGGVQNVTVGGETRIRANYYSN